MKKRYKLGVIGCGFMAKAIIKGAVLSDFLRAKKIIVSDLSEDNLFEVEDSLGVHTVMDDRFVAENCEYLLIAVKPQNFAEVAVEIKSAKPSKIISVMAGVKKERIKTAISQDIQVCRCMPNLPCSIGSGMMGVDMTDFNRNLDDLDFISKLFNCMGTVLSVDEGKMDAVTGISGSGPAYVFMFIDSLIDAGVNQGLTKDEAKILAVQTVLGGAEMVLNSKNSVPELIKRVCSKGGTTIEAIKVLEEENFRKTVDKAVDACVKRSKELSE
ncbi:MAG: pyrroline-5-carboxylate reductase [Clostridiales bacterium]|nr:pyrroline-5-carboxylate reductase [Clostridiales bacterium]